MNMPVLFLGHGSPMNALADNAYTRTLNQLGQRFGADLPMPRAILAISAHWETRGTKIVSLAAPQKINDFGGFPAQLSALAYPAAGSPALAAAVQTLIPDAQLTQEWGIDHGTWSVAVHLFAQANVPIVQLSMDQNLSYAGHYALGQRLRSLRDEGVLIMASGTICHNLRQIERNGAPLAWNLEFDALIASALERGQIDDIINIRQRHPALAQQAVPSDDHFLPLLYALGASTPQDQVHTVYAGFELASMSLRSMMWQAAA